jgi:hypothetical protein
MQHGWRVLTLLIVSFSAAGFAQTETDEALHLPSPDCMADQNLNNLPSVANGRIPKNAVRLDGLDIHATENLDLWRTTHRCGINATYAYLKISNVDVPYDELFKSVPLSEKGASLGGLMRVCENYSHSAVIVKATPATLPALIPAIAHCEEEFGATGHYVVVVAVNSQGVCLIDGTTGIFQVVSNKDFQLSWTGYILTARESLERIRKSTQRLSVDAWLICLAIVLSASFALLIHVFPRRTRLI